MSNVEGKQAHKLQHSSFDIRYSIFINFFARKWQDFTA